MRVVAGTHRGRRLVAPPGQDTRPTADRVRQALFNILEHGHFVVGGGSPVRGAIVLDAFAGTGAMGLEALSRGAARASFLDTAPAALDAIRQNVAACRAEAQSTVLRADATTPPPVRGAPATLAFLDPPYRSALASPALAALVAAGWLAEGAICTVEVAAGEDFTAPPGFTAVDERRYGAARIVILLHAGDKTAGLA